MRKSVCKRKYIAYSWVPNIKGLEEICGWKIFWKLIIRVTGNRSHVYVDEWLPDLPSFATKNLKKGVKNNFNLTKWTLWKKLNITNEILKVLLGDLNQKLAIGHNWVLRSNSITTYNSMQNLGEIWCLLNKELAEHEIGS